MRAQSPELRRLYTREGGYYTIPDWFTDDDIQSLREQDSNILPDGNTMGAIWQGIKNVPRGVAGSFLSAGQGITALVPGDSGASRWIKERQRRLYEGIDPRYRESFISELGSATGSGLAFLLPGAGGTLLGGRVAGMLASGTMGSLAGAAEAQQRVQDFEAETEENVGQAHEVGAIAAGTAIGATEALPLGRLLRRVAPEAFQAGARRAVDKVAQNFIASGVAQGLEEGVQEWGATGLQNLIERSYDENQEILASGREFGLGAGSGFIMDLMTRGVASGAGRLSKSAAYTAEHEHRLGRLPKELEEAIQEAAQAMEDIGQDYTPEIHQRNYDFRQEDDGTYSIIDNGTGEVVAPAVVDEASAANAIQNLERKDLNTAVVGGVMMKLRNQGFDTDPFNVQLGLLVSHPDYTHLPSGLVARYMADEQEGKMGSVLDPRSKGAREALKKLSDRFPEVEQDRARGIAAPAIRIEIGGKEVILSGKRAATHAEILREMSESERESVDQKIGEAKERLTHGEVFGFIDRYGRFLTPGRAGAEAARAGQLSQQNILRRSEHVSRRFKDPKNISERAKETVVGDRSFYDLWSEDLMFAGAESTGYLPLVGEQSSRTPSFVSMTTAREVMGEESFDLLSNELAMLGAAQMADMNRDVAANLNKSGIPKLRYHDASTEYTEQMLAAAQDNDTMPSPSMSDIKDLMEAKGWKMKKNPMSDPSFVHIVKTLIGHDKLNKDSDKRLLYTRLASLPTRKGAPAGGYELPDLRAPTYSQAKYNEAVSILDDVGDVNFNDFLHRLNMEVDARSELINHLQRAGIAKVRGVGKNAVIGRVDPSEVRADKNLEEGERLIRETIETEGVPHSILEETFRQIRNANALAANQTNEHLDDTEGSPKEKADYIKESEERTKKAVDLLKAHMRKFGLPVGEDTIGIEKDFTELLKNMTRRVVSGEPVGATVVDPKNAQAKILLNLGAFDPHGTKSTEDIFREMIPTMNYEILRWMREHDYFNQNEWSALRRFVRKHVVPETIPDGAGKTWFDWAREDLGDPKGLGSQEAIAETAIAKAFEAFALGHMRTDAPKTSYGHTFKKLSNHLSSVIGIGKEAHLGPAMSIFGDVISGRLGQRGPGLSALNPEGEVRSLKETDRQVLEEEQAFKRASSDIGAAPAEPRRAGLSEDEIAELEAKRIIEKDSAVGIPRVGDNASPEALNVYYNARDPDGIPIQNIRFKHGPKSGTIDPYLGSFKNDPVDYEIDDRTQGEKIFDAIRAGELLEDPTGLWSEMVTRFRERFVAGRDRIDKLSRRVNRKLASEGEEQMLASQHAAAAFTWLDSSMHYVKSAIVQGKLVFQDGAFKTDKLTDEDGNEYGGLADILALIRGDKEVERMADRYLIAKRVKALKLLAQQAQNKLKSQRGGLSKEETKKLKKQVEDGKRAPGGMTMEEASDYIKKMESDPNFANIVQFGKGFKAWNDSLVDLMVDAGIIAQAEANNWKGKMYLPFYKRHERDEFKALNPFRNVKRDRATRRATIETELEGTDDAIDKDLITRIVRNAENIIRDSMVNNAYSKAARDLLYLGEAKDADENDVNVVRFFEDGKETFVKVHDPYMVTAIATTDMTLIDGPWTVFPKVAQFLRGSVTRNPAFLVRNIFRDTLSAWVTSGSDYKPFIDSMKHLNDKDYEKAQQIGIALEHDFVNDESRYRSQIRKILEGKDQDQNWLVRAWDHLGKYSRMSDSATRIAVYKDVLDRTGNEAEAIYQAFEVINFGRRGRDPLWRALTAGIPFLNARIQGVDVLARAGMGQYSSKSTETPEQIRRRVASRGLMLAATTGLYYAMVSDEEWYKNMRDEIKDDYWLIPSPAGTLLKIPVPFEVGVLFKTIPEIALRTATEQGYEVPEAVRSLQRSTRQSLMFRISPQVFSPAIDVWRNKNTFTGREIVPQYMREGIEEQDQRNVDTNEVAKMIGEGLNKSPIVIEYLIDGYLGPMGTYAMMVGDKVARKMRGAPSPGGTRQDMTSLDGMPVLKSFLMRQQDGGGYQQTFYGMKEEVERAVNTINRRIREGRIEESNALRNERMALLRVEPTIRAMDRYMTSWRERRERILNSDTMTSSDKREAIRELESERDLNLAIVPFLREAVRNEQ